MRVIPPAPVIDATFVSSNVDETDYPEWAAGTTYAKGARVIRVATHRAYESVADGNIGNNPASGSSIAWINIGPTNRWAMFDQAVGSVTQRADQIVVSLAPDQAVDALAVLDTNAASVHVQVQAGGGAIYDRTQNTPDGSTTLTFLDLPGVAGATLTMTATGAGGQIVSIGTLIVGEIIDLGTTETTPQIGITDFSRRDTDDYGVTTVVERSWAKRMSLKTQIDTDLVDVVQRQIAAVRAKACLWIGEDGFDSLAVYGFFKDFSIDLSLPSVSYCTFTIEGLTTAGVLDNPIAAVAADVDALGEAQATEALRAALYRTDTDAIVKNPDGTTIRTTVDELGVSTADMKSFVQDLRAVSSDGSVKAVRLLNAKGYVSGNYALNDGTRAKDYVIADEWGVIDPDHANDPDAEATSPFRYVDGILYIDHARARLLEADTAAVIGGADSTTAIQGVYADTSGSPAPRSAVLTTAVTMKDAGWIIAIFRFRQGFTMNAPYFASIAVNGAEIPNSYADGYSAQDNVATLMRYYASAAGTYVIDAMWAAHTSISLLSRALAVTGHPFTS